MHEATLGRPLPGSRVHFVGVGGAGMAALAELLLHFGGYQISGSDLKDSPVVRRLAEQGVRVTVGPHHPEAVEGADHVIVSGAVPAGNPEVGHAAELGIDVLLREQLLGLIFHAGRGIAVAGTHGKTTTSSMLAAALEAADMSPSFVIGGDLNDIGSGARLGSSDLVVVEADEAYGSFAYLHPVLTLVTNVDVDHLDIYEDLDAIDQAFLTFLDAREPDGTAVVCMDDPGVRRILGRVRPPVVTYGFSDSDMVAERTEDGWLLHWHATPIGVMRPGVPGSHNALNAAGAAAAAIVLGADPQRVLEGLASFGGVDRRFSTRGERAGVVVIDDYAHNPAKVAAALATAREVFVSSRLICLFQPHLYSRTRSLAGEFGAAFRGADVVVVTDIYGAREEPIPGVSSKLVLDAIRASAPETTAAYVPRLQDAAGFVAGLVERGDVVLTLGAGDVTSAAPRILDLIDDFDASPAGAEPPERR